MTSSHRDRSDRGFTLVELLVVIGIVAVLVAMLLPALQRVREQAVLLDCLTRIRQCGIIAIGNYTADYKGAMLPALGVRSGFAKLWGGYNISASDGIGFIGNWENCPLPYNVMWADFIQLYANPQRQRDNFKESTFEYSPILYCAADFPMTPGVSDIGWRGTYTLFLNSPTVYVRFREFSWRMNFNVTPPARIAPGVYDIGAYTKIGSVRNASQKVLFVENHYECIAGADWGYLTAEGWSSGSGILSPNPSPVSWDPHLSPPRHRSGFVASFCDGSARIVPFAERESFRQGATYGDGPYWDLTKR